MGIVKFDIFRHHPHTWMIYLENPIRETSSLQVWKSHGSKGGYCCLGLIQCCDPLLRTKCMFWWVAEKVANFCFIAMTLKITLNSSSPLGHPRHFKIVAMENIIKIQEWGCLQWVNLLFHIVNVIYVIIFFPWNYL